MSNTFLVELASGVPEGEPSPLPAPESFPVGSDDYNSFLADIDDGSIESVTELNARLDAANQPDQAVVIDGQPLTSRFGSNQVENRRAVGLEAAILRSEIRARAALNLASQRQRDVVSFLDDVTRSRIETPEELRKRVLSGRERSSVDIEDSGLVNETRRIDRFEESIVTDALLAKNRSREASRRLALIDTLYSTVVSDEPTPDQLKLQARGLGLNPDTPALQFIYGEAEARQKRRDNASMLGATRIVVGNALDGQTPDVQVVASIKDPELRLLVDRVASAVPGKPMLTNALSQVARGGTVTPVLDYYNGRKKDAAATDRGEVVAEEQRIINDVVLPLRRLTLEAQLLDQINAATRLRDLQDCREALEDFETIEPADERLRERLRKVADFQQVSLETTQAVQLAAEDTGPAIDYIFSIRERPADDRYTGILKLLYSKEISDFVAGGYERLADGASPAEFEEYLLNAPLRRPTSSADYSEVFESERSELDKNGKYLLDLEGVVGILSRLGTTRASTTVEQINERFGGAEDVGLRDALMNRLRTFVAARRSASRRSDDYDLLFSSDQEAADVLAADQYEFDQGLGRNFLASRYIATKYRTVIQPLFETIRGGALRNTLGDYLKGTESGRPDIGEFRIDRDVLRQQRELTDIEETYLQSVELLSQFNPQLVALAREVPDVLNVYLQNHFDTIDRKTYESLEDDDYVPFVFAGTGPQGAAAAGEIARMRPDLLEDGLFVDIGLEPGGPFAVPEGAAFLLNSETKSNLSSFALPPVNKDMETKTVRAFGNPTRWFPGERNPGKAIREGSINTSVDYLPQSDEIAELRYADNEMEALALQWQQSMLINKALFRTEVISEELVNDGGRGDRIVTIRRYNNDGSVVDRRVRTDGLILASGLGKRNLGVPLNGTSGEVLRLSEEREAAGERPLFTDTLNAYRYLVSRERKGKQDLGKTWVFFGGGNSTDTGIELTTRLFNGGNDAIKGIEKVVVISKSPTFSDRPRYAAIEDVSERLGRPDQVQRIVGEVSRVDTVVGADGQTRVRFFGPNNSLYRNPDGTPIEADVGVSAAGFKPDLSEIVRPITGSRTLSENDLDPFNLPTNPRVTVAERLAKDPGTLLVGTASASGFSSTDKIDGNAKLQQLSREARRALLDNGAANAVAIGFRGPDTQAAIRLWLEERYGPQPPIDYKSQLGRLSAKNSARDRTAFSVGGKPKNTIIDTSSLPKRAVLEGIQQPEAVIEGVTSYQLERALLTKVRIPYTGSIGFDIAFDGDNLNIIGHPKSFPVEVFSNPFFLAYARQSIVNRKNATGLRVNLRVKKGRIDFGESAILADRIAV